jgi:hypothetical protein
MQFRLRTLLIVFVVLQVLIGCAVIAFKAADKWIKTSEYGVEFDSQRAAGPNNRARPE